MIWNIHSSMPNLIHGDHGQALYGIQSWRDGLNPGHEVPEVDPLLVVAVAHGQPAFEDAVQVSIGRRPVESLGLEDPVIGGQLHRHDVGKSCSVVEWLGFL